MTDIYLTQAQFAKYEGVSKNTIRGRMAQKKFNPLHILPAAGRGKQGEAMISSAALSPKGRKRFLGDPQAVKIASPRPATKDLSQADESVNAVSCWIDVKDAETYWTRSGQSVTARTLRRWCADGKVKRWRMKDGAYQLHINALPDAAQVAWYLDNDLTLPKRLRKGQRKDGTALDELTAEQRQTALRMAEHVRNFERLLKETGWTKEKVANAYCATEKTLTASKLKTEYRKWKKAGKDITVLAPKQRPGRPLKPVNKTALTWMYNHFCDSNLPNKALSARATIAKAKLKGWEPIPSESTLIKYLDRMPANVRIARQGGAKALDDKYLPSTLRDYGFPAMEIWVGDHHQFDVIVRMPNGLLARLWLTAWMDMKSRLFTGWQIVAKPNSNSVAQSFYWGVKRHGSPKTLLIDNGKDYTCYKLIGTKWQKTRQRLIDDANDRYLKGAFEACGIEDVCRAIEYNAESKNIERAFRTVEEQFCSQLAGYVGRNHPERHRIEDKLGHKIEDDPNILSAEEFITQFERYLAEIYHQRVHTGEGMKGRSPAQCMAQEREQAAPGYVSEDNLAVLFLEPKKAVMQRFGLKVYGQWYRTPQLLHDYWDPDKSKEERTMIVRIDEEDLTQIRVYDGKTDSFVGMAPVIGKGAFRNKDEIERRKHEHKILRELREAWWAQQDKILNDDITPAERIGMNEETQQAVVNESPRQTQGKDDKVTRIIPKMKGADTQKEKKKVIRDAVQDAATHGEGTVKLGTQTGAKVIDLGTLKEKVERLSEDKAAKLRRIDELAGRFEREESPERRETDNRLDELEAVFGF